MAHRRRHELRERRLRRRGGPRACLWLASPWTDLTMSGGSLGTKDAVDPLIHKAVSRKNSRRPTGRRRSTGATR